MSNFNNNTIIYQLTVGDLQTVAEEELKRELTEKEVELLEKKIGNYIDWYGAIQNAIFQNIIYNAINSTRNPTS